MFEMQEWYIFGNKENFSFQFRFAKDPDSGSCVSSGMSASWGFFRIFVNSINICESVGVIETEHGPQKAVFDSIGWYLLPLFRWLAENWNPLFHESIFPDSINTHEKANTAYNVYDQFETVICDVETKSGLKQFKRWQKWWGRHALRASSEGAIFPDIFFRRFANNMEVSWGDSKWPGMPEGYCLAKPGAKILPLSEIAPHLFNALTKALEYLQTKSPVTDEVRHLARVVDKITKANTDERLRWFTDINKIKRVVQRFEKVYQLFLANKVAPLFVEEMSPPVMMFGAVSPTIDGEDVDTILNWIDGMLDGKHGDINPDISFSSPIDFSIKPAEDGYNLAQNFLDNAGLVGDGIVDIQNIYDRLGIRCQSFELKDKNIRAISIVVEGVYPMVAVNLKCPFNQGDEGFRFTLAHELCHILHDREYGKSLAIVSGPWAPIELEKRANAFAAMLLMPRFLIEKRMESLSLKFDTVDDVVALATSLKTSPKATFAHLSNIGFIDYIRYELMKSDIDSGVC